MDFSKKFAFEEKEDNMNTTPFKENALLKAPELYCETDMGVIKILN